MRNVKPRARAGIDTKGMKPRDVILAKMLECHEDAAEMDGKKSISFVGIMDSFVMCNRNSKWRDDWKALYGEELIAPEIENVGPVSAFQTDFVLTEEGLKAAGFTPKDILPSKTPKTNKEHHDMIRAKLLNNRGIQIFDLLLERGPMSRLELAAALGISDRGAYFSYALQDGKEQGYFEVDPATEGLKKGKKVRLSAKCFVAPPNEIVIMSSDSESSE